MLSPNTTLSEADALDRLGEYFDIDDSEHDAKGKRERQNIIVEPHFQLIFATDNQPVGAEVLVRFQDTATGKSIPLPPALKRIEQSPRRMFRLSAEMIDAGASSLPQLIEATRNAVFGIWINTPGSGVSRALLERIITAARRNDIATSQLGLEILEGDREVDSSVFGEATPHGIPFALDDLGSSDVEGGLNEARKSGILSLQEKSGVQFHKVKVDRTLRKHTALYLTAICRLLHLFPEVTVEGIENAEELRSLVHIAAVSQEVTREEAIALEDEDLQLQLQDFLERPTVVPNGAIPRHLSIQGYIDNNRPRSLPELLNHIASLESDHLLAQTFTGA